MTSGKQPHILNASSNLLGICFVIITGLKLTGAGKDTFADEVSLLAALSLMGSCVLSYISMRTEKNSERTEKNSERFEKIADYLFLAALLFLFVAVIAFSRSLF